MSILNHFGKVRSQYKKYECELPEYKGYVHEYIPKHNDDFAKLSVDVNASYHEGKWYSHGKIIQGSNHKECNIPSTIYGSHEPNVLNMERRPLGNGHFTLGKSILISDTYYSSMSPELYVFSFTTLIETFSKCYEKVREKIYSELWKTIECCPFINITDLLILKQNDTDKHIEHLEEIIKALIDDNKLLQTKINSLESQMSLFKSKIPVAVAVESTSNSCEKTVAEEILYELD
jgi:hypothetical protein